MDNGGVIVAVPNPLAQRATAANAHDNELAAPRLRVAGGGVRGGDGGGDGDAHDAMGDALNVNGAAANTRAERSVDHVLCALLEIERTPRPRSLGVNHRLSLSWACAKLWFVIPIALGLGGLGVYLWLVADGAAHLWQYDNALDPGGANSSASETSTNGSFAQLPAHTLATLGAQFETRGQFGDSFGVVNAFFAFLAAVGAGYAVRQQSAQLAEQRRQSVVETLERRTMQLLDIFTDWVRHARDAAAAHGDLQAHGWDRNRRFADLVGVPDAAAAGEAVAGIEWFITSARDDPRRQAILNMGSTARYQSVVSTLNNARLPIDRQAVSAIIIVLQTAHGALSDGWMAAREAIDDQERERWMGQRRMRLEELAVYTTRIVFREALATLRDLSVTQTLQLGDDTWMTTPLRLARHNDAALDRRATFVQTMLSNSVIAREFLVPFRLLLEALALQQQAATPSHYGTLVAPFLTQLTQPQLVLLFYMALDPQLAIDPQLAKAPLLLSHAGAFTNLPVSSLLCAEDIMLFARDAAARREGPEGL